MSRYNTIETVTFTDKDGNQFPIKPIRPLEDFKTGQIEKYKNDLMIDELASRKDFYGDEAEDQSYAIIDHNAEKIVENDFDLNKIKELKIPIIQQV